MDKLIDFAFLNHKGVMAIFQAKSEISKLLKIVNASRPRYILEIGTAGGGTLFLFCRTASENAVISSVDLPGGRYGGGYPTWKIPLYRSFASKHQQINLIRGNSHDEETLAKVKSILNGRKIDFLFIDGDHTYEGVRNDFEMYAPLVGKNRLIALHDIVVHPSESVCGVRKFWDEVKSKYKHEEIVENSEQKWAGIGILHT